MNGRILALVVVFALSSAMFTPPPLVADETVRLAESVVHPEVMTRCIVHEALAAPIRYEPLQPIAVSVAPPAPLVETKPGLAPELEREALWIPGYWDWDAERDDFVWVSGVWRFPPPNARWLEGRWAKTSAGFVREQGSWLQKEAAVVYVKQVPKYKGRFVTRSRLAEGQIWIPGVWLPVNGDFTWREGFVTDRDDSYVWIPAHYTWTEEGWRFNDGYWDFLLAARGQAFAAVRFDNKLYNSGQLRLDNPVPIPSDAIQETADGEIVYELNQPTDDVVVSLVVPRATRLPALPAEVSVLTPVTTTGTVQGVVRRGDQLVPRIQVELVGLGVPAVETNDLGEFAFLDVPYGEYFLHAEGPVKNYVRRGVVRIDVDESVEQVEVRLR